MRDKVDEQVGSGTPLDQIAKSLKYTLPDGRRDRPLRPRP